jgi:hypothetical protein
LPEQDLYAPEAHYAEEVLDVVLPSADGSDEAKRKVVLLAHVCGSGATGDRRASACGDHLDAIALSQVLIQAVTVIGLYALSPINRAGEGVEETLSEHTFNRLAFVRRSAFDTNGERKTVIIGESDDFRPLAAFGGADREAPFFAPVKKASIKASSSCSFP